MKEQLSIGSSPWGESCAQLGTANYEAKARRECQAFVAQLGRHFETIRKTTVPKGCTLYVKSNSHDYGTYYEVNVKYDDRDEEAMEAAYWLEGNRP
jgi:hypothetical protein